MVVISRRQQSGDLRAPINVTFDYLEEQIVYDFNSDTHSSTFDAEAGNDPSDHLVELIFKYDNGFAGGAV